MDNQLIKIFNQYYIGFQERARSEIDETESDPDKKYSQTSYALGFLTPYEENTAGKKRIASVDRWADQRIYEYIMEDGKYTRREKIKPEHLKSKVIQNEMTEGFRLAEDMRRIYWGGGNVVWRIEDPRGWEFEISSANLARIIEEVGIQPGGLIPGKCILGRIGANNVLIPDGTEYWKKATLDAEEIDRRSKVVSKNEVKIGSICELKSGRTAIYMGHYFVTILNRTNLEYKSPGHSYYYREKTLQELLTMNESANHSYETEKYHAFKIKDSDSVFLYREKKVVSTNGIDNNFDNETKCLNFLNENSVRAEFASSGKCSYGISAFIFTKEKPKSVSFKLRDISKEEILDKIEISRNTSNIYFGSCGYNWSKILVDAKEGHCLNSLTIIGWRETITLNGRTDPIFINNKLVVGEDNLKAIFSVKYKFINNSLEKTLNIPLNVNTLSYFGYRNISIGEIVDPRSFDNGEKVIKDALTKAVETYNFKLLTIDIDGTVVDIRT